jgi:hypothetical protein
VRELKGLEQCRIASFERSCGGISSGVTIWVAAENVVSEVRD